MRRVVLILVVLVVVVLVIVLVSKYLPKCYPVGLDTRVVYICEGD